MLTRLCPPAIPTIFMLFALSSLIGGCSNNGSLAKQAESRNTTQAPVRQEISPGELPMQCQSSVFLPARFRDKTLKLRVFEGSPVFTNIPATIEWHKARYQIAPARYPQETVPAVYREVTEKIPVLRYRTEIIGKPATYKTLNRPVTTQATHRIWKKNCVATDPQQCLLRIPAKIQHIKQQIVDIPARTVQIEIPEKTLELRRKVLVTPGQGTGTPIPAQYQEVRIGRVSKIWQLLSKHQPSRYEDILVREIIRPETIRTTTALCTERAGKAGASAIQQRLNAQGYLTPVTGVLDNATLQAVIQFQQDNDLFIGAITLGTLKKLGLY